MINNEIILYLNLNERKEKKILFNNIIYVKKHILFSVRIPCYGHGTFFYELIHILIKSRKRHNLENLGAFHINRVFNFSHIFSNTARDWGVIPG